MSTIYPSYVQLYYGFVHQFVFPANACLSQSSENELSEEGLAAGTSHFKFKV